LSIYRRGKVYHALAWRNGVRHRTSLKTTDRAIAERTYRGWLDKLDRVARGEKVRRSFAEAEERFIRTHLSTLKPRSVKRYGDSLKHLVDHFGRIDDIATIDSAMLSSFEERRRADGVTSSTIRRDLACLSSLMTSCIECGWIDHNIVPGWLLMRSKRGLKEGNPRTRYLTEGEEQRLLAAATAEVVPSLILALDTGLRMEEIFSLQWWQVDFERRFVRTTTNTKSGRQRVVPLPARAAAVLERLPRSEDVPYVLVNPDTRTRYVHQLHGLLAAVRRSGLMDVQGYHDLRRTAGCRWLQRDGKSIGEVSTLLGHSSVQVTEKSYAFFEAEIIAASITATNTATVHESSMGKRP
jgi:integrase